MKRGVGDALTLIEYLRFRVYRLRLISGSISDGHLITGAFAVIDIVIQAVTLPLSLVIRRTTVPLCSLRNDQVI